MSTPKENKGTYAAGKLPVASSYPKPPSRAKPLLYGLLAGVIVLALALIDYVADEGALLANGALSSAHAGLERECTSCHIQTEGTPDGKCQACHERFGEPAVYGFVSHYLYRDDDFNKVVPAADEHQCAACHPEHNGREATPIAVTDKKCATCHDRGSFAEHKPWPSAGQGSRERSTLAFPHIKHVRELMKRNEWDDPERTCAGCHVPEPDGRGFTALSFDRFCDGCHLTETSATPRLPIARDGGIGVETLASIQASGRPDTYWSYFANPNEYQTSGGRFVSKRPLHHADPFVMENLRLIRQALYLEAPLADLLSTIGLDTAGDSRAPYREALDTLERYAKGLRGRPEPEVQTELAQIEGLLVDLRDRLEDPYAPIDETAFMLDLQPDPDVSEVDAEEWRALAADLTATCTPCHEMRDLTIAAVAKDQTSLHQATFDHRAHILERSCLDCHNGIPIREAVAGEEVAEEADVAGILNLPDLESCRDCHAEGKTSAACITCHEFHPEKTRRGRLTFHRER